MHAALFFWLFCMPAGHFPPVKAYIFPASIATNMVALCLDMWEFAISHSLSDCFRLCGVKHKPFFLSFSLAYVCFFPQPKDGYFLPESFSDFSPHHTVSPIKDIKKSLPLIHFLHQYSNNNISTLSLVKCSSSFL